MFISVVLLKNPKEEIQNVKTHLWNQVNKYKVGSILFLYFSRSLKHFMIHHKKNSSNAHMLCMLQN